VQKEEGLARGTLAPQPAAYTFINLKTGERKTGGYQYGNPDHQQFNPTDPNILLYAHEGTWHEVDRTWTIHTDTTGMKLMHKRTMDMEINGHEWWSFDGKTVWYDLQTPRGEDFWLAGYNVETGERTRYHLQRDEWSIHFNVTTDGKLFCGDGGDPGQVAKAKDGQWIYLFRPQAIKFQDELNEKDFVQPGVFRSEKLVNMAKHNYRLEPNVSFTPDQKWVVFRSNMFGDTYTFAVEVAKAQ
jgi:oligogalacturonide lyase